VKGELRRQQILDSALRLFAEKGYYETHIDDIIRDLRIGRGTVYQYFANKDDIFFQLLEDYYHRWKQVVAISDEERKINDPVAYLRMRIRRTLAFFAGEREFTRIYLRIAPGINKDIEPLIERIETMVTDVVRQDLELARRFNHLRDDIDISGAANLLIGALHRTAYYDFIQTETDADIGVTAENFVRVFTAGIFKRNPGVDG